MYERRVDWDTEANSSRYRIIYNHENDILYMRDNGSHSRDVYGKEDPDGVVLFCGVENDDSKDKAIGVTIFDFSLKVLEDLDELMSVIPDHLKQNLNDYIFAYN